MTDVKFNAALIVGAGSGLSASLARALAKDGIKVALAARTTGDLDPLVKDTGARAFSCDASKRGEVEKLFADLDASLGAPDIVVYNASFRTRGPFVELDPLDVEKALAVTAYGGFLVAQEAARRMLPKKHGATLLTGAGVGVVAWDYQTARIADRAGVDIVSVGDSVGVNLWGHSNPLEVTLEEILVVCKAVRRAVTRALVSCDFPYGPLQEGSESAVRAAIRLVKEGGADLVKLDGAADFPETVRALTRAGIPVFAQFGITPQTALRYGIPYGAQSAPGAQAPAEMTAKLVEEAKLLEDAGAALIDFTNSGPVAGAAVVRAVAIPVLGGFGGGPWLDGRMRMAHTAIGYGEKWIDAKTETYANVAKISLDALSALIADVRAGRQIRG